jgi:uncharacterized delta-60 repeat protein
MSCNYYVNDNPSWVGTMYISGTTCSGTPAAYNLSYGDSVCMDNEEPMVNCDPLTISGACLPVTPTPSPALGYLCFSTGKTYTTTDYICPNNGNTYQDIYGKILVEVFEDYEPDYSHAGLSFTVSNGVETKVITIPPYQSFAEFVFCRQEFNYTSSGCSVTVLPDWIITSMFAGYELCPDCFESGSGFNQFTDVALPEDGTFVVGGGFTNYSGYSISSIINLNNDGSINYSKNLGTVFGSGAVWDIKKDSSSRFIICGTFTSYDGISKNKIVRLNNDGSIDSTFNIGTGFTTSVGIRTVEIQPDGKILCGGTFTQYNGTNANNIIRLNSDGSVDTSFNSGSGFVLSGGSLGVTTIAIQPDGKILCGGFFGSYNGTIAKFIIRLNSNGSVDTSFDTSNAFNLGVNEIKIDNNGKYVVGGSFTTYSGLTAPSIIRLNTNGYIDNTFNPVPSQVSGSTASIVLLPDNKILIGGSSTVSLGKIKKLNTDGSLDTSFYDSNIITGAIRSINILSNNKIVLLGFFNSINGNIANYVTLLNGDGTMYDCLPITPTPTSTVTPTITPTQTQTQTNTPSNTQTQTNTPTITSTPTLTPSPTATMGITPTATETSTPTQTVTPSITPTNTETPTNTPTQTNTQTPTNTSTQTPTNTSTPTNTPTPSTTPPVRYILSIFARLDPTDPPVNDVELYYSYDNVTFTASGVYVTSTTCAFVANLSVIEGQTAYIRWVDQFNSTIVYEFGRDTTSTCPALSTICTDFVLMNIPKTRSYTIGSIACADPAASPTQTPTITSTPTQTPTNSGTPTNTPTNTQTPTGTPPVTPTNTQTATNTPTNTQTPTTTPTPTNTPPTQYIVTISARLDPTFPPLIDVELYYSLDNVTFIPSGQLATSTTCTPIVFLQVNAGSIVYTKWVDPTNASIIYQHGRAVGSTCPALSTICVDFFTVNANGSRSYTIGDQTC